MAALVDNLLHFRIADLLHLRIADLLHLQIADLLHLRLSADTSGIGLRQILTSHETAAGSASELSQSGALLLALGPLAQGPSADSCALGPCAPVHKAPVPSQRRDGPPLREREGGREGDKEGGRQRGGGRGGGRERRGLQPGWPATAQPPVHTRCDGAYPAPTIWDGAPLRRCEPPRYSIRT
jgi:hypothetical protein